MGTWAFELVEQRLTSDTGIDTLQSTIDAIADKERTVLKLALVGQITLAQSIRLDRLLKSCADRSTAVTTMVVDGCLFADRHSRRRTERKAVFRWHAYHGVRRP